MGRIKEGEIGNKCGGDGVSWYRGSMLGKGSFGSVYLATLKNPRSKYSCLPAVMAVKSAEVSISGSIQKEKEVLSNIKGCPSIIRCYGEETTTGENGTMFYNLLLEYGSGGTLSDRIIQNYSAGHKGLSEFEVMFYTKCLLLGLSFIHEIGYVHCDMKPDNILLVPTNKGIESITQFRAKIGDFGLSKREAQGKKRKLEAYWRGTPRYMSPEAVLDGLQDRHSDIWALGCIVLEMLTGKPPWDDPNEELTPDDIIRKIGEGNEVPKIPSELSKEAKDFLKGCFVRNPRYRLTAEMLLNHPFVEAIVDDDEGVEELPEIQDINEIESVLFVSEPDEDWDFESDEDSFYYWTEEDDYQEIDDDFTSQCNREQNLEMEKNRGIISSTILGAA